jgi:hypothetical protein
VGEELARALAVGLRDLGGLVVLPRQALPGQILIVGEAPAGQEVRLCPLHQILDATFLLRGAGIAELWVKAHLRGEAPEGGIPPRLPRGVAAERHRLHVVEDPGPRHPAPALDDVEHRAQQGLQIHLRPPPDRTHAAVLQPPGEEDALDQGAAQGDPRLAPVPLHELARQPLEADHRCCGALALGSQLGDEAIEGGGAPGVGRGRILVCQLQHPGRGDRLRDPAAHRRAALLEGRDPPTPPGWVRRLREDPRHRVPVTSGERDDARIELPLLLQELDRAPCHSCKHPPSLRDRDWPSRRQCPNPWRMPAEKRWHKLTENLHSAPRTAEWRPGARGDDHYAAPR